MRFLWWIHRFHSFCKDFWIPEQVPIVKTGLKNLSSCKKFQFLLYQQCYKQSSYIFIGRGGSWKGHCGVNMPTVIKFMKQVPENVPGVETWIKYPCSCYINISKVPEDFLFLWKEHYGVNMPTGTTETKFLKRFLYWTCSGGLHIKPTITQAW